jgi:RNA polymerase sigma-70 factor (ECF subfamily)
MLAVAESVEMSERAGTQVSFEVCYERYRHRVFHLCLRYGAGNSAWAEDVTQEVFLKLLAHLPALSDPEDLGGWLYRVATNQALSRLRKDRSFLSWVERAWRGAPEETDPPPDRLLEQHQDAATAMKTLEELPGRERIVLCMKLLDGKSQKEIAQTLALSEGYVSKLVARATARVRAAGWEVDDAEA